MDSDNVLSITYDIEELDKDFYNWLRMSDELRHISDSNCIAKYGVNNRVLYNNLKSKIMFNKPFDKELLVQSNNTISEAFDFSNIDRKDLIMKIGLVKTMNSKDLVTAILYPYDPELMTDSKYMESYRQEFLSIYNKFIGLNDKYQNINNMLSMQIFGYNVYNMYRLIAPDVLENKENDTLVISRDFIDSYSSAVEESFTEDFVDKNIIELYRCKFLHSMSSISETSTEGIYSRMLLDKVNQYIYTESYENQLNSVVSYFTLDEYRELSKDHILDDSVFDNIKNSNDYYRSIVALYNEFNKSKNPVIENKLLSLGWNPYVDPIKYMSKVRDRQVKWFNEHSCRIVDLSKYDNISTLIESTSAMRKIYKEMNAYPVYIVLTYVGSAFSKLIRKIKKSTFTHAGLTLDSDLKTILTFMFDDNNNKGFCVESLDIYLKRYENASIDVLCLFVDSDTLAKLQDSIAYFTTNKAKTKYNFKNLINILRNKAKDNDPENLSMVCSQFVDTILKLAGLNLTNKSSNLVIPQDFEDLKHPRLYKMFEGYGKDYNEEKVEGKIYNLLNNSNPEDIRYLDFVEKVSESMTEIIYHRYNIVDNIEANKLLQEFYNYISINPLRVKENHTNNSSLLSDF